MGDRSSGQLKLPTWVTLIECDPMRSRSRITRYRRSGAMMLGVPVFGVEGSVGLTVVFAPGAVLRLLGLVVSPPELPPGPLPTVGLLCGIEGMLGVVVTLPGPEPPGTPTPPGLKPPLVPLVAPPPVPLGAAPVEDDPALPPADPALPPPPAPPPELCATANVEPARNIRVTAIESFMSHL
jgi:hypothetical protein